jgi:maltooligosyltrehalose synthase
VERAQAVLDDMKSGAFLYVEGVVNGVRERQHVWTAVEADIERELDKTLKSVARIERSTRAVQGHQATVMGLQEMMEVYTDLLGKEAEHEAISERIAEAVGEVAHKLTDLQAGTAAKVKKVVASGKPRGSKVFDAAVDVLVSSGSAMHYRDIMNAMVAAGSYDGSYKSSDRSVNDVLRRRIAGGDTRVKIIGRGIYQVA